MFLNVNFTFRYRNYPGGYQYYYHINRSHLIDHRICRIRGSALAALSQMEMEQVSFSMNITFDPVVSSINVKRVVFASKNYSACVFTCYTGVCPHQKKLYYEWSIYSGKYPVYNGRNSSSHAGDLSVMPNQLLVDGTECNALYSELGSDNDFKIACKVSIPSGRWAQKSASLNSLLGTIFKTGPNRQVVDMLYSSKTAKQQAKELMQTSALRCSNLTQNCLRIPLELESEAHPCDPNQCVFRCNPRWYVKYFHTSYL